MDNKKYITRDARGPRAISSSIDSALCSAEILISLLGIPHDVSHKGNLVRSLTWDRVFCLRSGSGDIVVACSTQEAWDALHEEERTKRVVSRVQIEMDEIKAAVTAAGFKTIPSIVDACGLVLVWYKSRYADVHVATLRFPGYGMCTAHVWEAGRAEEPRASQLGTSTLDGKASIISKCIRAQIACERELWLQHEA